MRKYIVYYRLSSAHEYVYIEAESLKDAFVTAETFSRKTGAILIGVCLDLS